MKFGFFCPLDAYGEEAITQIYRDVSEQVRFADVAGVESFQIAESHFSAINGSCPAPPVFLSALFQQTERIKLGTAVCTVPFHHPLHVAENYALLDMLSNGRLIMGIGSGFIETAFNAFQIPLAEKQSRFDEALEIIRLAWRGQRFSYHGEHYCFDNIQLTVTPTQAADIPFWVSVARPPAIEAVAHAGHSMIISPFITQMTLDTLRDSLQAIRTIYAAEHPCKSLADVAVVLHTHVATSTDAARDVGFAAMENRVAHLVEVGALPGSLRANQRKLRFTDNNGLFLFGCPALVRQRLGELHELGIARLILFMDFGGMAQADVLSSMRLFVEEVLPYTA